MSTTTPSDVANPNPDRPGRSVGDRRRRPTSPWDGLRGGRRARLRRAEERVRPYFVDRYGPRVVAMGVLLMALSVVDAAATLLLLDAGCEEVNPAMRLMLGFGVGAFLVGKFVLTGAGDIVLAVCQNHYVPGTRLRVRHVLPILVGTYLLLNAYQAILMVVL